MRLRIAWLLLIALSPLVVNRASGTPATGQVPPAETVERTAPPEPSLSSAASRVVDEPGSGEATRRTATMLSVPAADGEKNLTGNAALEPDPGWQAIMTEDFEGTFPSGLWQVHDNNGNLGGEVYWDDDDYKPHSGLWSAWCANGGADGLDPQNNDYPNNMNSVMVYGPFDLSDTTQARLRFYYWNDSEPIYDTFKWTAYQAYNTHSAGGEVSGNSGGWQYVDLDLSALTQWAYVYIGFSFTSDGSIGGQGAFVDDIVLEKPLPNLVPYKPDGWDYPIVPSSVPGTNSVGPLYVDQPTYISWCFANIVPDRLAGPFGARLYFDDIIVSEDSTSGPWTITWCAHDLTPLEGKVTPTPGPHTLRLVVDPYNNIVESNENDNIFEMTFTWLPALPGAFSKSSPAPGATGQPTNLGLIWRPSSGADSYEYCYDTTNDNNCDGSWKSSGGRAGASLSGLSPGTTYYWQVRAVNARGVTYADGGTWWSFTTAYLPGSFGKISPVGWAMEQPTNLTLSWGSSNGATSYEYCYDTTNDNNCDGSWISTGGNTSANISGLTKGTTYYWQVRARNTAGTTEADGGAWNGFTTQFDPPGAFGKASPANGATGQPTLVTFSWTASSGATGYEYCLDTTNDNTCSGSWEFNGTDTGFGRGSLTPGTTYYWQVRARNTAGKTEADNGTWWSFRTTEAVPNLAPYTPQGWDYPIVPSSEPGTHSVNPLYANQAWYIDGAVINKGGVATGAFNTCLYMDGSQITCWNSGGLEPGGDTTLQDWVVNGPTAGTHTLKIVADANNEVAESNENDNTWEMSFTWLPGLPSTLNWKVYLPLTLRR